MRGGIALERTPVADQCEAHAVALLRQPPSRDEAIATIVAGASEDENACADVDHAAGGVGDHCAGALHEVKRRHGRPRLARRSASAISIVVSNSIIVSDLFEPERAGRGPAPIGGSAIFANSHSQRRACAS